MACNPDPVTLFVVAFRAAEVVDPADVDGDVVVLLALFEDADEPISVVLGTIQLSVAVLKGRIDPQDELPAVQMMAAVIVYLGHRRDEVADVDADILRMAARAEYDGDPPAPIEEWLADQGVAI